eukprot:scaffold140917_cov31-Prasinocladus_malaysianus.AAC.1
MELPTRVSISADIGDPRLMKSLTCSHYCRLMLSTQLWTIAVIKQCQFMTSKTPILAGAWDKNRAVHTRSERSAHALFSFH